MHHITTRHNQSLFYETTTYIGKILEICLLREPHVGILTTCNQHQEMNKVYLCGNLYLKTVAFENEFYQSKLFINYKLINY